jgi:hypothetical protein
MSFDFELNPEQIIQFVHALGPGELGAVVIENSVSPEVRAYLQRSVLGLPWRSVHAQYTNDSGHEVDQRHGAYALKTSRGDQSPFVAHPYLRETADAMQRLIRGLSFGLPQLEAWEVDEVSSHYYDDPELGLSRHRDQSIFIGAIAIYTAVGEGDFAVYTNDRSNKQPVEIFKTKPGTLAVLRASSPYSEKPNLCPDHAVLEVSVVPRVTIMARASRDPDVCLPGFTFDNWQPDPICR